MHVLLKFKLNSLKAEIQNIENCIQTGDKDALKRSLEYAANDLTAIGNIARNLSDEEMGKN